MAVCNLLFQGLGTTLNQFPQLNLCLPKLFAFLLISLRLRVISSHHANFVRLGENFHRIFALQKSRSTFTVFLLPIGHGYLKLLTVYYVIFFSQNNWYPVIRDNYNMCFSVCTGGVNRFYCTLMKRWDCYYCKTRFTNDPTYVCASVSIVSRSIPSDSSDATIAYHPPSHCNYTTISKISWLRFTNFKIL